MTTASTTYEEPYHLARRFASLDIVSGGRVGWNAVTSAGNLAARNFKLSEQLTGPQRYRRPNEFVELALKLWDSYEDDAFPLDAASGLYIDVSKLHSADHHADLFDIRA